MWYVQKLKVQKSEMIPLHTWNGDGFAEKFRSWADKEEHMIQDIDAIRINFSSDTLVLMNFCLAFIMFGVALDMKLADFRKVVEYPKAILVGLSSQLILLPLLTLALILAWQPHPSMALGLVMVAACPGGNISNFAVHLSRGNTALSVSMTSIVTIGAIVTTPLYFLILSNIFPGTRELMQHISVNAGDMFMIIIQLILIPLVLGMVINHRFPKFTARVRRVIRIASILIFAAFILFALLANYSNILEYLHLVFLLVIVHNILAMLAGYWYARLFGLNRADAKAICMETGIQNSGLGLVLIFNFFSTLGGMMLVAAFWGVWDLISSFLLSLYWNKKDKPVASNQGTPGIRTS